MRSPFTPLQRPLVASLAASLLLGLVACSSSPELQVEQSAEQSSQELAKSSEKDSRVGSTSLSHQQFEPKTQLQVVTTVAPITNIVSNIAGDRVRVVGLVPEGTNSHTFQPRPSDGELLANADLVLVNGLSLEVPSIEMAQAVKPSDTEIYELGTNTLASDEWLFDNSFPESEGKPNPHLWVNPDYAAQYAKLAAEQLILLDPDGKTTYEANLTLFLAQLADLDRVTQAVIETIPAQNRKLLTYHDSWPYWARKYGFDVIGALQPSDFSEPSAREVAALIDQIRESQVPAIFGSEVFPSRIAEQIARESGVILENTADDDLPGEGSASAVENNLKAKAEPDNADLNHTYIGMMADNLRIFATALGGDASAVDSLDVTNVVK